MRLTQTPTLQKHEEADSGLNSTTLFILEKIQSLNLTTQWEQ